MSVFASSAIYRIVQRVRFRQFSALFATLLQTLHCFVKSARTFSLLRHNVRHFMILFDECAVRFHEIVYRRRLFATSPYLFAVSSRFFATSAYRPNLFATPQICSPHSLPKQIIIAAPTNFIFQEIIVATISQHILRQMKRALAGIASRIQSASRLLAENNAWQ